jgi:tRNA threonylcarbamoyladenosine dehydratase
MDSKTITPASPIIFRAHHEEKRALASFRKKYPVWKTVDIFEKQVNELFEITHPSSIFSPDFNDKRLRFLQTYTKTHAGSWVYFPWNGTLLHMVDKKQFDLLATNRNKNLITHTEQMKLENTCIAIAGLSVGSGIATTLAYQHIGNTLKFAEFDTLETTNLNRMKAVIRDVGKPKLTIVSEQVYDINPFITLQQYPEGLRASNLLSFVHTKPKPNLIFEIIDDFEMKIRLRLEARKEKIPVVSMANLGDSVLIDVERFDLSPTLPLFNGVLGDLPESILNNPHEDKNKYAVLMVGKQNVPERALESVHQIGKTLVGRPQLGSTVTTTAGFASYLARMILLKQTLPSGRYRIAFSNLFKTTT